MFTQPLQVSLEHLYTCFHLRNGSFLPFLRAARTSIVLNPPSGCGIAAFYQPGLTSADSGGSVQSVVIKYTFKYMHFHPSMGGILPLGEITTAQKSETHKLNMYNTKNAALCPWKERPPRWSHVLLHYTPSFKEDLFEKPKCSPPTLTVNPLTLGNLKGLQS